MNQIIENLGGIGMFGVVSVCLFVIVFSASLIWAFCQKKSLLESMESLPLEDGAHVDTTTMGMRAHGARNVAGETPATATGKSEQIRDAPLAVLVAPPKGDSRHE
jgi:hypothetical protein